MIPEDVTTNFQKFFQYVCSLHPSLLAVNSDLIVMQAISTLKFLVWNDDPSFGKIKNDIFTPLEGSSILPVGMSPKSVSFTLKGYLTETNFTYSKGNGTTSTYFMLFHEDRLVFYMFTDEKVYSKFGKAFCLAYDVAIAKVGTEAVFESAYSVWENSL